MRYPIPLVLLIGLLSVPFVGQAQVPVRQVDVAAVVNDVSLADVEDAATIVLSGRAGVCAQITGTHDMTLSFEVTADGGSTWVAQNMTPTNSTTAATSTSGGTNGIWCGSVSAEQFRVRNSADTSGTAVVDLYASMSDNGAGGGGGGSTQYAEDAIHGDGNTGTLALVVRNDTLEALAGTDGDNAPLQVDANGALYTVADLGATDNAVLDTIADGITAEGPLADDGDVVAGTTTGMPMIGFYESTPTACTDGDGCIAALDANRNVKTAEAGQVATDIAVMRDTADEDATEWQTVRITDGSAYLTPASDVTEDAAETAGGTGPMVLGVRRDAAASSSGTDGDNSTVNLDALGLLWTRNLDPCSGVAKSYIPIDVTTATTTELTASLSGASNYYYVCSFHLVTAAANNISLVDDDTDGCGSVTAALVGGLTAAEGYNLGANGGLTLGNGTGSVMRAQTANSVLCLVTSAATQVAGHIVVAAAP